MPSLNSAQLARIDDTGILAQLMPNRTRAKLLRFSALFCIVISSLFGLSTLQIVFSEIYKRHEWPVARGSVLAYERKQADERDVHPENRSARTMYWTEFQVQFDVPAAECRTGTTWGTPQPFPCIGVFRTPPTRSWQEANAWTQRHPLNSPARILHDPVGPGVEFADESAWFAYPWEKIFIFLGLLALSLVFFNATQRRLRFLEVLPEDYDATVPPTSQEQKPDELIDLKLS